MFSAEHLAALDSNSYFALFNKASVDGYVKIRIGGTARKTKVVTVGSDLNENKAKLFKINPQIHWNQQFVVAVQKPVIRDTINLEVWDANSGGADDTILGSIPLKIRDILKNRYEDC